MAADALGANDAGASCLCIEGDGLMTAVLARYVAAATADAAVEVNLREDDGVAVEVGGGDDARQRLADEGFDGCYAALGEIVLETEDEVVDDAVAVLHDSGTHLHVAAAQLDELQCVAPGLDASDAAQFDALAVYFSMQI